MAFATKQFLLPWRITLVPISEMVEAITTAPPQKSVKKGQWVRMKGGLFKNDIALVRALIAVYVGGVEGDMHSVLFDEELV